MSGPLVILFLVGAALAQDPSPTTPKPTHPPPTIARVLGKRPHYSMFLDLLQKSGLITQLDQLQNLTLFAPSNAALSSLSSADFNALESDTRRLTELLQYHASDDNPWKASGRGRNNDRTLTSLDHDLPIRINVYRDMHSIAAEGINITQQNMKIENGYIHGIDGVMEPPKGDIVQIINMTPELSTLASLIASSGLDADIKADQNITLFAPTNDAFSHLSPSVLIYLQNTPGVLAQVLQYHIVPQTSLYSIGMRHQMLFNTASGQRNHHDQIMLIEDINNDNQILVNNAQVSQVDTSATNGVLHEIDDVLIPTRVLVKMEDMGLGHHVG
jgi:uncharacterized surface protein with fasciclin (FAS1) repeats